jgi:predicted outer membrane protein
VRLEIARQYADLLRAELETAAPAEFDRQYLAIEVYNQMQVLAMLRVFEGQASDDFARILRQATTAAEGHASECKQVAARLQGTPATPAAAKSESLSTGEIPGS